MYAISDMMRISLAQYVIVFLVTVVSAFFVGQDAAYTALNMTASINTEKKMVS